MSKTYEITGMKCQGCANAVTEKLSAVKGVEEVKVDLEKKQVTIEGKPWKLRKGGPKRTAFFDYKEVTTVTANSQTT